MFPLTCECTWSVDVSWAPDVCICMCGWVVIRLHVKWDHERVGAWMRGCVDGWVGTWARGCLDA